MNISKFLSILLVFLSSCSSEYGTGSINGEKFHIEPVDDLFLVVTTSEVNLDRFRAKPFRNLLVQIEGSNLSFDPNIVSNDFDGVIEFSHLSTNGDSEYLIYLKSGIIERVVERKKASEG